MDTLLYVLAVILVMMFFSCLAIPFLLIRREAWPETMRGRSDAIITSLSVALQAIVVFAIGTLLPSGYFWSAMGIALGILYGLFIVFVPPADIRLTLVKAISFCLQALVTLFAVICFVSMTVGGQENAPHLLSTTLFFQQLWIIAFIAGAAAPALIGIKHKGRS